MLNAVEMLTRVRQRIHDRDALTYDDNEVLSSIDDALREVFTTLRTHGELQEADNESFLLTALTQVETDVFQLAVPEYVGDIKLIEAYSTTAARPVPIAHVNLEEKDLARAGTQLVTRRLWHWGPRRTLQVRGSLTGFQGIRLWFIRAFPPMLWLTTVAGSTTTINTAGATVRGSLKARDGLYVGQQFEVTGGGATNLGQVRTCTAFTGGVMTVDAFPATTSGNTIAMVLPMPDENADYVCWLAAEELLTRSGATEYLATVQQKLARLRDQFAQGVSRRTSGEPPRFSSSRRY